jgi:FkbM family methyltransferase
MIEFSAFQGRLSRELRRVLRLVPADTRVRILQGPLRGARWIAGASTAGCWLGSYERAVQDAMVAMVARGDTVYDVGANVGFFTLLASRLVGAAGRVYAFEPIPETAWMLRRHVEMNHAENVQVVEAAVSDEAGELRFIANGSKSTRSASGTVVVRAVVIDEMYRRGDIGLPSLVKMDVEGWESAALRGMRGVLAAAHPKLLIEFHGARHEGPDDDSMSRAMLHELGYRIRRLECGETVAEATDAVSGNAR